MKKHFLIILVALLWCNVGFADEKDFLICKEKNRDRIDTYSFDTENIYSGAAKYRIITSNDIVYGIFENDPKVEWGYIRINRIDGTLERAHGLIAAGSTAKASRMFKTNMIFEINYNCKKTEKKF